MSNMMFSAAIESVVPFGSQVAAADERSGTSASSSSAMALGMVLGDRLRGTGPKGAIPAANGSPISG